MDLLNQLTDNFTLNEMCTTSGGRFMMPSRVAMDNLKQLCSCVLQKTRDYIGVPIIVNSGYRDVAPNKAINGDKNSQHLRGEAADIVCSNFDVLIYFISSQCNFDQLIIYSDKRNVIRFVHVSYTSRHKNRKMVIAKRYNT